MTVLAKVCTFLNGNLTLTVVSLLLTSIKSVLTQKGIWPKGGTDFLKVKESSFPSINQAKIRCTKTSNAFEILYMKEKK